MKKNNLPSGWRVVELGSVIIINESNYNIKDGWKFINYLDTGNITENNISNIQSLNTKTDKIPSRAKRKIQVGDIVYSTVRPNQRHYGVIKKNYDNLLVSTGFATIRAVDKISYTPFIYWFLTQNKVVSYLQTIGEHSTSTYPAIKSTDVEKLKINLPSLPEQKVIAHILGKLDDKIELNRQINQTLETMAQTLFKSWFVNFDPVIDNALKAGNPIPDPLKTQAEKRKTIKSTLPKTTQNLFPNRFVFNNKLKKWIPEGWEVKDLDKIANFQNGLALQKFRPENETDDFLPVLKITHLKQGKTDGKEKSKIDIKKECIVNNGDIIFSWSASLFVDVWCGGDAALNQHLFKVTSVKYPKWFYYQWTKCHLEEFIRIASGKVVTMGHIKKEHLSEAKCVVMSNKLLGVISSYLENNLNKQIMNKLEMENLTKLRDTLLPKLISGKIRISQKNKER